MSLKISAFFASLCIVSSSALLGCSSEDDVVANLAVEAGADRSVADAADVGTDVAALPTVTCGAATCTSVSSQGTVVAACCSENTACGFMLPPNPTGKCVRAKQPGAPDKACPSQAVARVVFDGCCKPDGVCGLDDASKSGLGLGCFSYGDFNIPAPDGGVPKCAAGDAGADADVRDANAE